MQPRRIAATTLAANASALFRTKLDFAGLQKDEFIGLHRVSRTGLGFYLSFFCSCAGASKTNIGAGAISYDLAV